MEDGKGRKGEEEEEEIGIEGKKRGTKKTEKGQRRNHTKEEGWKEGLEKKKVSLKELKVGKNARKKILCMAVEGDKN